MLEKDYNTEILSKEIRDLISSIDKIVAKKDEINESIKKVYLNCSSNN